MLRIKPRLAACQAIALAPILTHRIQRKKMDLDKHILLMDISGFTNCSQESCKVNSHQLKHRGSDTSWNVTAKVQAQITMLVLGLQNLPQLPASNSIKLQFCAELPVLLPFQCTGRKNNPTAGSILNGLVHIFCNFFSSSTHLVLYSYSVIYIYFLKCSQLQLFRIMYIFIHSSTAFILLTNSFVY